MKYKQSKHKQSKTEKVLTIIFIVVVVNTAITSIAYRFMYPNQTEIQAFLKIPQTFLWDFTK